jgi:[protein-PII] uridylyltransferase
LDKNTDERPQRKPAEAPRSVAAEIAVACERQRAGQSHGEAGAALKRIVESARRSAARDYARGDVAAERLAGLVEEAVRALFEAAAAERPDAARSMAVAAVGGFGRGLLAPYSDIDLLILHGGDGAEARPIVDFILYPLWDGGLKASQSVHTPQSAVQLARADMTARTSFLDARLLAGSKKTFADFSQRYEKLRKQTKKPFFNAKDVEREARHQRSEQSRFLAEPDLKEGKGGLRDLHVLRWLYKYEHGAEIDGGGRKRGAFSPEDLRAFKRAERFLWSVRVQLHALRGRADEKLSFDVQPALAERLGYADRGAVAAAERLMRHYFVNAMEIGRLTRLVSARMEEERLRLSPAGLRVIPGALLKDEAGEKANLKLEAGRLHFQNPAEARQRPLDLFRLFRAFSRRPEFDFHPDALAIVSASVARITSEVRRDPAAARLFLAAIVEGREPLKLLRVMAETGLLGKYVPTFGKIIGRVEYGLYRRFSIDEGVFQAIGVLDEIAKGRAKERHPIATRILAAAKSKAPFYLAALLHEARWSVRDPGVEAVERLIGRIARRLGLTEEDAEDVAWSAARHALLAETAERRNVSEPAAVAGFAGKVKTRARLDLLLVLGVCHYRVVGAYSWDGWTRRQIADLYEAAAVFLEGGDTAVSRLLAARAGAARKAAAARLSSWPAEERGRILAGVPDDIAKSADPDLIARIADLVRSAEGEGAAAAVSARLHDGVVEAIVYAGDRKGLLADLAGAVAAAGGSVRSVQVTTTAQGKAIDLFTVQSIDGAPIADAEFVRRLHAKLLAAGEAPPKKPPQFSRRIGDRRAMFAVPPQVRIEAEGDRLIVETEGQDRPGLLFDLCAAIAGLDIAIVSAHIATYGARAVDAFYIDDHGAAASAARRGEIEERLLAALADGGGPRTPLTDRS